MSGNESKTPVKSSTAAKDTVTIPATPYLRKIGFGTGVAVYRLQRSPCPDKARSPWAIKKVVKKESRNSRIHQKRLYVEAQILRELNHPNVVGFRGVFKNENDEVCLAMEVCDRSLGDAIEQRQDTTSDPFPAETINKVGLDISRALDYMHNQALLLHCDVKSYNILVKGDFEDCKLCDFGVCLPLDKYGYVDEEKTGEHAQYVGTPVWFAPEVARYPQEITTKADIYSFGLVLWEMLALKTPLDEDTYDSCLSSGGADVDAAIALVEAAGIRKRPPLPDFDFGAEYKYIIEVYTLCTEDDLRKRPRAQQLKVLFEAILTNKA